MAEKKLSYKLLLLQLTYGNCFFICTSQITAGHNIILFPVCDLRVNQLLMMRNGISSAKKLQWNNENFQAIT